MTLMEVEISTVIAFVALILTSLKMSMRFSARLSMLETKVELFWSLDESQLPKILHSPHTPELDNLIEKLQNRTIEMEELIELKRKLETLIEERSVESGKLLVAILVKSYIENRIETEQAKRKQWKWGFRK